MDSKGFKEFRESFIMEKFYLLENAEFRRPHTAWTLWWYVGMWLLCTYPRATDADLNTGLAKQPGFLLSFVRAYGIWLMPYAVWLIQTIELQTSLKF